MKNSILVLFSLLIVFSSCDQTKEERQAMLPKSSGNLNNIQVVIENDLWTGEVGETIRKIFAAPVDGLPQQEPLYSLNQLPPQSFEGFTQQHRNFIFVQKGKETNYRVATDHYARPQKGIFISAQTNEELLAIIEDKAPEIINDFYKMEVQEKHRRMSLSLLDIEPLKDSLGVSLKMPSVYRFAKITNDFVWLRKDIRSGDLNILVYEMPLVSFENEETRMQEIISMRDSIGKTHIPGPTEGSHMITEKAFSPYIFESEVDGKFAYEVRGTWEVFNFYMAGPFISYIIKDEKNDRYLVIEGFTFAPSVNKRDYQFELDAIIKSAKIE
tara:strand:+ start:216502 stop:217482 length:981 start_codon:yes stop_codon:yes gene_type:complete